MTQAPFKKIKRLGKGTLAWATLLTCSSLPLFSQDSSLGNALARVALHPVAASQAEVPEAPQTPPVPPTPPAPGSLKDDLFAGTERFAKGASDVTEVNMDPDSLNMVGGENAAKAHRTLLNVVRTYTYEKPGMYNPADVDEYRHKLETGDWHCSVHTRDLKSGESTDVCSKRRGSDLVEHAIITASPKSLTFIHTIRRANGQGGSMDWGGASGLGSLQFFSPGLAMDLISPEIEAERIASEALLHAQMAQLGQGIQNFQFESLKGLTFTPPSPEAFHFHMSPEQEKQVQQLQKQLEQMKPR